MRQLTKNRNVARIMVISKLPMRQLTTIRTELMSGELSS